MDSITASPGGMHPPAPTNRGPVWLSVDPGNIPRELTSDPSWYPALIRPKAGKVGTWDKIPGDPKTGDAAYWKNPATRCTFDVAFMAYESGRFGGVGYMLHAGGVVALDLDHSVSPDGTIAPWAQQVVDSFPGAYWERSVSGTGLRGFCRGNLGDVGGVRSKIEGCSVEVYADVRFVVVTGQALATVDELVDHQDAIDALRARLTAGRVRATGTAIGSGLTGATTSSSPEVVAIVEAVMSSRHGQRLGEIWMRDELHVAGASEDDWALACEIAYQAIRLGHRDDELAHLVEQTMRAGPYRAKWDERRGGVTWLAQDVANAIATVTKRLGDRPVTAGQITGQNTADVDTTPTDETPEQIIARLERQLDEERLAHAQTRSIAAVQMTRIRTLIADVEQITARLAGWKAVLSNPRLKPADRIVAIPMIESVQAAQANGNDEIHIRYPGIVSGWGIPESTVGKSAAVLTEMEGAPLAKRSDPVVEEWGPNMRTYVRATVDGDLYAAIGTYDPCLPQRGGRRARQPECRDHPEADLIERKVLLCATCRKPVAQSKERHLCRQIDGIGETATQTVSGVNLGLQNEGIGGHDGEEQSRAAAMVGTKLIRPDVDSWKRLQLTSPDQPVLWPETEEAPLDLVVDEPDWLQQRPSDAEVSEHVIPAVFRQ